MRFRRDAPAVLVVAIAMVIGTTAVASHRLFADMTHEGDDARFELMQAILRSTLRAAESRALARAEMLAELPVNRALLAAGDRAGLLAENAELFRVQHERFGVDQIQFHVPPAVSFLRLHAPALFGDDLARFRPMVVAVNATHTSLHGIAVTRTGPALLGVAPVRSPSGGFVGSVEVGISFSAALGEMKGAFGVDGSLYVDEHVLRRDATAAPLASSSAATRLGRYLRYCATDEPLLSALVDAGDLAAVGDRPAKLVRELSGRSYGVVVVPLRNHAGTRIGLLAAAHDLQR